MKLFETYYFNGPKYMGIRWPKYKAYEESKNDGSEKHLDNVGWYKHENLISLSLVEGLEYILIEEIKDIPVDSTFTKEVERKKWVSYQRGRFLFIKWHNRNESIYETYMKEITVFLPMTLYEVYLHFKSGKEFNYVVDKETVEYLEGVLT